MANWREREVVWPSLSDWQTDPSPSHHQLLAEFHIRLCVPWGQSVWRDNDHKRQIQNNCVPATVSLTPHPFQEFVHYYGNGWWCPETDCVSSSSLCASCESYAPTWTYLQHTTLLIHILLNFSCFGSGSFALSWTNLHTKPISFMQIIYLYVYFI